MKSKGRKSFLSGIPSWALSLMAAIFSLILLFIVSDLLSGLSFLKNNTGESLGYFFYGILIAAACFFICRKDPASIWYVPVLCNLMGIVAALIEPNFWVTSMYKLYIIGWVLSIIGAVAGFVIGRQNSRPGNSITGNIQ